MNKFVALGLTLFATGLVPACGNSGSSNGSSNCAALGSNMLSPTCESCVIGQCGSQYSTYCSDNCAANSSSTACQNATTELFDCVLQTCPACITIEGGGGSNTSSGGFGATTGGSGTGMGGVGGVGASAQVRSVCYIMSEGSCINALIPASNKDAYDSACMANGGTMPAGCPTTNLTGCCTLGTAETCLYTGSATTTTQDQCIEYGGVWSATP